MNVPITDTALWEQAKRVSKTTVIDAWALYIDLCDERDNGQRHDDAAIVAAINASVALGFSAYSWRRRLP